MDEIDKAIKKRTKEKQEEIDQEESSDESDKGCGATEKVIKQDEKKLCQWMKNVKDLHTLNIVLMIKYIQFTDGANIF